MIHFLNGDALKEYFPWKEHVLVCRECLIDGPVTDDEQIWQRRAAFIELSFAESQENYFSRVKSEFDKLVAYEQEICLWFEHDLFCQVNCWFTLSLLNKYRRHKVSIVYPLEEREAFEGFAGHHEAQLTQSFERRMALEAYDMKLASNLWSSYSSGDLESLRTLSHQSSVSFPHLQEVIEAHLARLDPEGRPQLRLREIFKSGITDFNQVFREFQKTERIYGFGDSQVKAIIGKLNLP